MTATPTPPHHARPPPSRGKILFVAGIALLGTAGVGFAATAASSDRTDFVETGAPAVANGNARVAYALPTGTDVRAKGMVMGSYDFPNGPGDVYVLGCDAYQALLDGRALPRDAFVLRNVREGMFHEPVKSILSAGGVPGLPGGCTSAIHVVLEWDATGDWRANRPSSVTELVQGASLDGPLSAALLGVAGIGGVGSIAGGVAWRRERQVPGGR